MLFSAVKAGDAAFWALSAERLAPPLAAVTITLASAPSGTQRTPSPKAKAQAMAVLFICYSLAELSPFVGENPVCNSPMRRLKSPAVFVMYHLYRLLSRHNHLRVKPEQ